MEHVLACLIVDRTLVDLMVVVEAVEVAEVVNSARTELAFVHPTVGLITVAVMVVVEVVARVPIVNNV